MKSLFLLLSVVCTGICFGGPNVSVHENAAGVSIRNHAFDVVRTLSSPEEIAVVQRMFRQAKKIGTTKKRIISPTHTVDFSDRWLVDMESGTFAVLTKQVTDVYQLSEEDLKVLKNMTGDGKQRN